MEEATIGSSKRFCKLVEQTQGKVKREIAQQLVLMSRDLPCLQDACVRNQGNLLDTTARHCLCLSYWTQKLQVTIWHLNKFSLEDLNGACGGRGVLSS